MKEKLIQIDQTTKNLSVLFADIVDSSHKWAENPNQTIQLIENTFELINEIANEFNGTVCNFVGDLFRLTFHSLEDSIRAAIKIKLTYSKLFRIGVAYGPVHESLVTIQNDVKINDCFGNTINVAARLESNSFPGEISFTNLSNEHIDLTDLLNNYNIQLIKLDKLDSNITIHINTIKFADNFLKGVNCSSIFKIHL